MIDFLQQIDMNILHFLHSSVASSALDVVMPFVTSLGNAGFIWLVVAAILMAKKEYRAYGLTMIGAMAAAFIIGDIGIKNIVGRPRPFLTDPTLATTLITLPITFSFPSGHTSTSFAAAIVLCAMPLKREWIKFIPLAGAILVAFSRAYLCVHYPTDIIAGFLLGTVCGLVAIAILAKRTQTAQGEANE